MLKRYVSFILSILFVLTTTLNCLAESISVPNSFTSGTIIQSAQVNTNFSTIYSAYSKATENMVFATDYNSGTLNSTTLNAAITAIGSSNKVLYIKSGSWAISTSVNFPANVTPFFAQGALLNISAGTVTVGKELVALPQQKIFNVSGTGAVSFTAKKEISADWFNTNNDGVTEDSPQINAAIDSLPNGGVVLLPSLKYLIETTQLSVKKYVLVQGLMDNFVESPYKSTTIDIKYGHDLPNSIAILFEPGSGLRNVFINYPDQVAKTASTPEVYGWALGTDGASPDTEIRLENLNLYNPYKAMYLDWSRVIVNNVIGQPLSIGLYASKQTDTSRFNNIHFWTYYTDGSGNLFDWVLANGTAFDVRFVANAYFSNCFAYGYNKGWYFTSSAGSAPWAHINNSSVDWCNIPIYFDVVNRVDFTGGRFISSAEEKPTIVTSSDTGGYIKFTNCEFSSVSSVNAEIASTTGYYQFDNCDFQAKHTPVISAGATVKVNNSLGFDNYAITALGPAPTYTPTWGYLHKLPLGGAHTFYNGVPNFDLDTDKALSNFDMAAWGGSPAVPTSWTMIAGATGSDISQITNGIALNLTPGGGGAVEDYGIQYTIPTAMQEENGNYIVEFDYEPKNVNNTFQFYLNITDSNNEEIWAWNPNFWASALITSKKIKLRIPMMYNYTAYTPYFRILWRASGTVSGTIELTNLKIYKQENYHATNTQIDSAAKVLLLDPYSYGVTHKVNGPNSINRAASVPSAATSIIGDRVEYLVPADGGSIGAVNYFAGSPGNWRSFGSINDINTGNIVWDPGSLATNAGETSGEVTVTGAAIGDYVAVSPPYDISGFSVSGYVTATNTVKITIVNINGANPTNLGSGTWTVRVIKP